MLITLHYPIEVFITFSLTLDIYLRSWLSGTRILVTFTASIVAAKPHSVDVKCLIRINNKLKSSNRVSLSPGTIKNYMGDLEAFDPLQAAIDWLRERLPEMAQQQEWFLIHCKEASIFKEQQKFDQTKKEIHSK